MKVVHVFPYLFPCVYAPRPEGFPAVTPCSAPGMCAFFIKPTRLSWKSNHFPDLRSAGTDKRFKRASAETPCFAHATSTRHTHAHTRRFTATQRKDRAPLGMMLCPSTRDPPPTGKALCPSAEAARRPYRRHGRHAHAHRVARH